MPDAQHIDCPGCKQYVGWTLVENHLSIKQKDKDKDKVKLSSIKKALLSALFSSELGKKLHTTMQKLKISTNRMSEKIEDETRLVLPGYLIKPNMNGVYTDWIDGYKFPETGRGILRFTAEMANDITIAFSSNQNVNGNMYEIALGSNGNTKVVVRSSPQGNSEASVNYSITNPITIEITFDKYIGRLFIEKVEADNSKTMILNYNNADLEDIQYISFTGLDSGGRIHDVHINRVTYPSLEPINNSYVALVALQSQADDKYLIFDEDGLLKSLLPEELLGMDLSGWFIVLTDGEVYLFINILGSIFNNNCCFLQCEPQGCPCEYIVTCNDTDPSEFGLFNLEFNNEVGLDPDIVYIKSLSTGSYLSNHRGAHITTANLAGEETAKGPLEQFKIKLILDICSL